MFVHIWFNIIPFFPTFSCTFTLRLQGDPSTETPPSYTLNTFVTSRILRFICIQLVQLHRNVALPYAT